MSEDDEPFNPYSAPESDVRKESILVKVPGWLLVVFGLLGLATLAPSSGQLDIDIMAAIYCAPMGVGAIIFGSAQIKAGKNKAQAEVAVVLGAVGIVGGVLRFII